MEDWHTTSLLIFGLRVKPLAPDYCDHIRNYLTHHTLLSQLLEVVKNFPEILSDLSSAHTAVAALPYIANDLQKLTDWISGRSNEVAQLTSGAVFLPLLTLIQITQYFNFLHILGIDHRTLVSHVEELGGIQGYCGGLLCALGVASSISDENVVSNAAVALRLAFVIGVFGEIGDTMQPGSSMMIIKLNDPGQMSVITKEFPKIVIAAVTEPKSVTVSGSHEDLSALTQYVETRGMRVQDWPWRGKWHHPDNHELAQALVTWCQSRETFQFSVDSNSPSCVRSNRTGKPLTFRDFLPEAIFEMLSLKSQWHAVLTDTAIKLKHTGRVSHALVNFGVGDCTPLLAFNNQGLRMSKVDGYELFRTHCWHEIGQGEDDKCSYPDDVVAIVGASCRLPGASDLDELWSLLSAGRDQHQELSQSRFNISGTYRASQAQSFVKDRKFYANLLDDVKSFDNAFFSVNTREAASMDPQQRLLLELAYEALESSGYLRHHRRENGDRVACFVGASAADYHENTSSHAPTAYTSTGTLRSFIPGKISHHFGWTGPSEVIDTACSSSLVAIARACSILQTQDCVMAVAGGVNVMLSTQHFFDLGRAGFLSPTGQCKPFDQSADGYCRADGAGFIVLKLLSQAKKDSDQILGVIAGATTNQGGLSPSIIIPHLLAQTELYRSVLRKARMSSSEVSYVEAHGTGTQVGDPIEMESIRQVFGASDRPEVLHIGSLKGNIGHCEAAAGVAGLLKIITMLMHRRIPPQVNFALQNPNIAALLPSRMTITTRMMQWQSNQRTALVTSYGASGSNAAVVVSEPPTDTRYNGHSATRRRFAQPIMLSAANKRSVDKYANALAEFLSKPENVASVDDLAFTLNSCRKRHEARVILSATDTDMLVTCLRNKAYDQLEIKPCRKGIVLVLAGQGKNYVGISRKLYERYERVKTYIDECDNILMDLGFASIVPAIFQTEPIRDPIVLHCSMVASQIAFARCWLAVGLKVDAVIGHSLGELAALAVTDVLSTRDCLKLVAGRAKLMMENWGPERGSMLVVEKSRQEVERAIQYIHATSSMESRLEIACYNATSNHVVVGSCAAITELECRLESTRHSQQAVTRRLNTEFGFHSEMTSPILEELGRLAASLTFNIPKIHLETCHETGSKSVLPYDIVRHTRDPVFFASAVERVEERLGSCVWIEAGMNTSIIPMVEKCMARAMNHSLFSVTARGEHVAESIVSDVVTKMWRAGVDVDSWVALEGSAKQIWLPPYQFDRSPHWLENIDRAAEMTKQLSEVDSSSTTQFATPLPPSMVSLMNPRTCTGPTYVFSIDTSCERFCSILNGHKVRGIAMAPATLYLECVVMAMHLLDDKFSMEESILQEIKYHAPVTQATKHLQLLIERSDTSSLFKFSITSVTHMGDDLHDLLHATGQIVKGTRIQYGLYHRMFKEEKERLDNAAGFEMLLCERAYQLFDSVVSYNSMLRGMQRISLGQRQASADIRLPSARGRDGHSPVSDSFDSVIVDALVQPLGLLVNSCDLVTKDHILVCDGIECINLSSTYQSDSSGSWKVYAKFTTEHSKVMGDVFVYSTEDLMVGVITGCSFNRLGISRLEKLLSPPVTRSSPATAHSMRVQKYNGLSFEPASTPNEQNTNDPQTSTNLQSLKRLVATYTNTPEPEISDDTMLEELGLDSLAAQEMSNELQANFGTATRASDLYGTSLGMLAERFAPIIDDRSDTNMHTGVDVSTPHSEPTTIATTKTHELQLELLHSILRDYAGLPSSQDVEESTSLFELGIDSLATLELKQEISDRLATSIEVNITDTVGDLISALKGGSLHTFREPVVVQSTNTSKMPVSKEFISERAPTTLRKFNVKKSMPENSLHQRGIQPTKAIDLLYDMNNFFDTASEEYGFKRYWSHVAPRQNELVIRYIVEAFANLGVNLDHSSPGQVLPRLSHNSKHEKVVDRFWKILHKYDIVETQNGVMLRGSQQPPTYSSSVLYDMFVTEHPLYACEARLMAAIGANLSDCLSDKLSALDCLFGSAESWKIIEDYYHNAPVLVTVTEQLVAFALQVIKDTNLAKDDVVRILEVGGGTGGTTKRFVKALSEAPLPVKYTFSDISPSLVRRAKQTFIEHSAWMDFQIFDLEKSASADLVGQFDIVIGTSTVHATTDRAASMAKIKDVLKHSGIVVLSEPTRVLDWLDLVFGLLDGWWLAEHGSVYPLQHADVWMQYFHRAGFRGWSYSRGRSKESRTQQLLLACKDEI